MAEEPKPLSRRKALGLIAGGIAAAAVPSMIGQAPSVKMQEKDWPILSKEEKALLQIPLSREQGIALLEHKVNAHIFDQDSVISGLKSRELWPHEWKVFLPVGIAKKAASVFYANIMDQYHQNNAWDSAKGETPAVGNVWRRFWEHASNHFNEADLKYQLALRKKYPKGPPYPPDVEERLRLNYSILGEESARKIRDYSGVDFATLNPKDEKSFALVTRNRPQLDFPYIIKGLGIDPDMLKIRRVDLEAIGINVAAELKKLPATAWAGRVADAAMEKTGAAPQI